ncbi:hypothetical protein [Nannocystis pusilla]|uniref:Uncharacterized protein n=1 Tax=Nannocystis pusilla TaxID=889268 RepID=A0ABS7THZ6_9BACT|nr:hypothetical protein [Nannocystis pusilla]MBZ5707830.1 hypothetical protein [Nannocystis pusilla]
MQPHPQHSPRGTDASWAPAEAKPRKRAKKPATGPKKSAKKSAAKKSAKKKPPTAAKKKQSTTKSAAKKPPTTKAPRGASPAVAALERKVADLEQKVAELSTLVAELKSSRDPFDGDEVMENPFAWIRRDPSIAQYHGQHVALHPTRGVVAHAFQLDAVVAEVRASGLPLDDIVLDFIADSPF